MYICIVTKGKGRVYGESADYVSAHVFSSHEQATQFKDQNEDLDSKYWTMVDIVTEGEQIEIGYYNEDLYE
jgi:hypothetical protein